MKNFVFALFSFLLISTSAMAAGHPVAATHPMVTEPNPVITVDLGDLTNLSDAELDLLIASSLSSIDDQEPEKAPCKVSVSGTITIYVVEITVTVTAEDDDCIKAGAKAAAALVDALDKIREAFGQ